MGGFGAATCNESFDTLLCDVNLQWLFKRGDGSEAQAVALVLSKTPFLCYSL